MATNPCYNPNTFTPDNKPLLSKGDWSRIQLYLQDCANLPLVVGPNPPHQFPFKDSVNAYRTIHTGAALYHSKTLGAAYKMGNSLYSDGMSSDATYSAVIRMMADNPPKEALQQLFTNLQQTALTAQAGAKEVYTGSKDFVGLIEDQGQTLSDLVTKYLGQSGGVKAQITTTNLDITSQHSKMVAAQVAITHDVKVIHDTVYYSWIPLIGSIVALVEIIEHEKDIQKQLVKQKEAVTQLQVDNKKLSTLMAEMQQLMYAQSFNKNQVLLMNAVLPSLQKIEGAWGTMASEIGDVLGQINQAEESALNKITCLAAVNLTTAQHEWLTVANDAHDFMMNFYVQPVKNLPKAA